MAKREVTRCCGEGLAAHPYPDHTKELHRINRIAGQLEGVKRMISERAYCPEIIIQIQAVRSALKSLEAVVLEKHLEVCFMEALESKDRRRSAEKMGELMDLFRRN